MVRTVVERKRGQGKTGTVVSRAKTTGDDSVGLVRKRARGVFEPAVPVRETRFLDRDDVHESWFG
jgi:hypothetical protein